MPTVDKPLYLGVDPDLRTLNLAVLEAVSPLADPHYPPVTRYVPLAIFLRRNKEGKGDAAVASAVKGIAGILDDFVTFLTKNEALQNREIVMVVESQNMEHARRMREKGKKVSPQDLLHTGQIAGIWMGVFADVATRIVLVQPAAWKAQVPKSIHHQRIYKKLSWNPTEIITIDYTIHPIYPLPCGWLVKHSSVVPNPGDFMDINDSIGLALWGAENNK